MDFVKNAAQQAQQFQGQHDQREGQQPAGGNQEQLSGMLGALNSALGQQNKEGGPAPANNDQIAGLMGTLNNAMNNNNGNDQNKSAEGISGLMGQLQNTLGQTQQQEHKEGSSQNPQIAGIMGMVNNAMGGGAAGEAKEDKLDKAIDMFQEHVMKAGPQSNESAIEQAKDQQIKEALKGGYKKATGKDLPF